MTEQTTKLIEALAIKLGTTTEYLWSVLIKQAPIDAMMNLFYIIIAIVFTTFAYKMHKYYSKPQQNGYSAYDNSDGGIIIVMIFVGIICLAAIIIGLIGIDDMVTALFNPEYWALERILKTFK